MKHTFRLSLAGAALCIAAVMMAGPGPAAGDTDSYGECSARCAPMDGEEKARCISTCVRVKKRNAPVGESEVKTKMRDCEERCASYTGVEKVRCIRICLDLKEEQRSAQKQKERAAAAVEAPDPCESKCGVLSGSLKDKCMARCKKETKFERGTKNSR